MIVNNVTKPGTVYLVGAGPGDPGLISVKGLHVLQRADVVLYDGLVNPLLLRHSPVTAERTARVDTPTGRVLKQSEINQRLIESARQGKTVVRLKGGDPFIFGRGSEEALALSEAGIPFEVIPGVTSAVAAGEYAGISLTHRELASSVAFVTGHEDPTKPESSLDYENLATFSGTLVFYMGLHRLPQIVESLLKHGKSGETPACVISKASTPEQKTVVAPLCDLPDRCRDAGLVAPSLIIVGHCVDQRQSITWFEKRPLFGKRIGITRPVQQAGATIEAAWELGAMPILMPTIEIAPPKSWGKVDEKLRQLSNYDWLVFTSVNGIEFLFDRLWQQGYDVRQLGNLKIACIGSATAEKLAQYHLRADVVPKQFRAEALAEELIPLANGERLLWARASRGRDVLIEQLTAAGSTVDELVVYQNRNALSFPPTAMACLNDHAIDWIGLSSPSIARQLKALLPADVIDALGDKIRLASISPVTTAAATEVGLPISAEATTYTWSGIFAAIEAAEASG